MSAGAVGCYYGCRAGEECPGGPCGPLEGVYPLADVDAAVRAYIEAPPERCEVNWGICPVHGNTLRESGGHTWCTVPECGRTWMGNRLSSACSELVTHEITADQVKLVHPPLAVCAGHAVEAMKCGFEVRWISGVLLDDLAERGMGSGELSGG